MLLPSKCNGYWLESSQAVCTREVVFEYKGVFSAGEILVFNASKKWTNEKLPKVMLLICHRIEQSQMFTDKIDSKGKMPLIAKCFFSSNYLESFINF